MENTAIPEKVNLLHRLLQYHEDIESFIPTITKLSWMIRSGKVATASNAFKTFCESNIDNHFLFEERIVFPVVDELIGIPRQRKKFEGIHRVAKKIREKLVVDFEQLATEPNRANSFEQSIAKFISMLRLHAIEEQELFTPIFKNDKRVNFMSGKRHLHEMLESRNKALSTIANDAKSTALSKALIEPLMPWEEQDGLLPNDDTLRIKSDSLVISSEGYTVSLLSKRKARYEEPGLKVTAPLRSNNDKFIIIPEQLTLDSAPKGDKAIPDSLRLIIASRIKGCLKKLTGK